MVSSRPGLAGFSFAACLGFALSCQNPQAFECTTDDDCIASGPDGACEANGFCSFPDMRCPSGRAYGDFAEQGLAGECVEQIEGSTGDRMTTTVGTSTTDVPLPSTSTTADASTSTTTTAVTTESTGDSTSTTGSSTDETGASTTAVDCGVWWNAEWEYRIEISYAAGRTSESLANFPLLIALDATRIDYMHTRPGGEDVRIVAPQAGDELPYERNGWRDGNDRSPLITRLPELDPAGGTLHLYYGNGNASDVSDADAVYADVLPGVSHTDATTIVMLPGVDAECTTSGGQEPGAIGEVNTEGMFCTALKGTTPLPLQQYGTASFWVRRDSIFTNDQSLVQYGIRVPKLNLPLLWNIVLNSGAEPEVVFSSDGSMGVEEWSAGLPNWSAQEWHHLAVSNQEGQVSIYFDGELRETTENSDGGNLPSDALAGIMSFAIAGLAGPLNGVVDEFRYSSEVRSADWLSAEVRSDLDQLLVFGDEEQLADCHIVP